MLVGLCHVRSTRAAMMRLREQPSLEDLVLVSDGHKISAHRLVMGAASLFIRQRLLSCESTVRPLHFNLPPMDQPTLNALIEFAYTGRINVSSRKVGQVGTMLEAARQLEMQALYQRCVALLLSALSSNNVFEIWQIGDKCDDIELQGSCVSFLAQQMGTRFRTSRYLNLPFDRYHTVLARAAVSCILSHDQLVRAILCWVYHSQSTRKEFLPKLLSCIRSMRDSPDCLCIPSSQPSGEEVTINETQIDNDDLLNICHPDRNVPSELLKKRTEEIERTSLQELDTPLPSIGSTESKLFVLSSSKEGGLVMENFYLESNRWEFINHPQENIYRGTACATLNNIVYFFGGETQNTDEKTTSCIALDLLSYRFYPITSMHVAKAWAGAASLGSWLFCAGGESKHLKPLSYVEYYSPAKDIWRVAAAMRRARTRLGFASVNGKLFAIGGSNGTDWLLSCEMYNPSVNEWTEICVLDKELSGSLLLAIAGTQIIVIRSDHPNAVHYFDAGSHTWKPPESVTGSLPARAEQLLVYQEDIYLIDEHKGIYFFNRQKPNCELIANPLSMCSTVLLFAKIIVCGDAYGLSTIVSVSREKNKN